MSDPVAVCPKHGEYSLHTGCLRCEKPLKIAVYAICKNEAAYVQGWIDNVLGEADYAIVTDTGSTDGTVDILKRQHVIHHRKLHVHQAAVLPFRFDVARNCAMANIPADVDFCVSLDMDERLDAGWRGCIERAVAAEPNVTRIWVNYDTPWMDPFPHDCRVHSRKGWRWSDPCHECIKTSGGRDVQIYAKGMWIRHHMDKSKARGQYLPLLVLGIMEEPWNRRRIFYLARELVMNFRLEEAKGWLKKYIELWEASGDDTWMEVAQAKALLTVCHGALAEIAAGREIPADIKAAINERQFGRQP